MEHDSWWKWTFAYPAIITGSFWLSNIFSPTTALTIFLSYICIYTFALFSFYRHTCHLVFNRYPSWTIESLYQFAAICRPIALLWRLSTACIRVTPSVCIVGEVRCGTTTVAAHLSRLPGAHPPFCPWRVGFADNKESFYFVGHYFGLVHPFFYRAAFPTIFEKWFTIYVLQKPFFAYDACAQYLTAPWVASLLKQVVPDARLIICVRNPVMQNLSWWRFEQNAMHWASKILKIGNTYWREQYPPHSLRIAYQLSSSKSTRDLYAQAEQLTYAGNAQRCGLWFLPSWAGTFPGGQLASFAANGKYINNIRRYLRFFKREQIIVIDLQSDIANISSVPVTLHRLLDHVAKAPSLIQTEKYYRKIGRIILKKNAETIHTKKNVGSKLPAAQEPTDVTFKYLDEAYASSKEELFALLGKRYEW